jgi:transcriptional regulator with XRE-family HTH domain
MAGANPATQTQAATEGQSGQDDIGARLRSVRQDRGLTLKAVATSAGLSESFLSQLERGQAGFSMGSLQRVAAALNIGLAELFANNDTSGPEVLTPETRHTIYVSGFGDKMLLTPPWPGNLEAWLCRLEVGGATSPELDTHGASDEFLLVLSGVVELHLSTEVYRLETGSSIVYRSSQPHRTVNVADTVAEGLWVMSPPVMSNLHPVAAGGTEATSGR